MRTAGMTMTAAALLLAGAVPAATAQSGEAAFYGDLPTVVTAGRLEQPRSRAPASVTIIDREAIAASGATDLPDLLRLVAGVQVGHVSGAKATVTQQGLADEFSRRMQVLVDGRVVYTPATSGVAWYDLPVSLENIERIEVTRGPNGASYGVNAFVGAIHIRTRSPEETQGIRVVTEAGGDGYRRSLVRVGSREGSSSQRLTWERRRDDGYTGEPGSRHDQRRHRVRYRSRHRPGVNTILDVDAGVNAGYTGSGSTDSFHEPDHDREVERYFGQVQWQWLRSSHEDWRVHLSYERADVDDRMEVSPYSERPGGGVLAGEEEAFDVPLTNDPSTDVRRTALELEHHSRPLPGLRLAWGLHGRHDELVAPGYVGDGDAVVLETRRAFLHSEWRPYRRWTLHAGVGVEDEPYTGTHAAPRLGANWHYHADHAVRLSATRARRAPSLLEAQGDRGLRRQDNNRMVDRFMLGNRDLEPERVDSVELALVGGGEAVNYEFKLFQRTFRDLIVGVQSYPAEEPNEGYAGDCPVTADNPLGLPCSYLKAHVRLQQNGEPIHTRGAELQVDWQPARGSRLGLAWAWSSAEGDIDIAVADHPDPEVAPTQSADSTIPDHTVALWGSQRLGPWRLSAAAYHVSAMQWIMSNELDGRTTLDLTVARDLDLGFGEGRLAVTALDAPGAYADFHDEYRRDRRLYAHASLAF